MSQKKKVHEVMRKGLRKEYFYMKRDLLLTCHVDFEENSTQIYYAALDKDGMSIYRYAKETESRIQLIKRYPWSSWNHVKIDHYLTKSQFVFQGERNLVMSVFYKGKELKHLIEEHTSLSIEELPRPLWRKLPGYRSHTVTHMYVASISYTAGLAALLKALLPYRAELALFSFSIGWMLLGLLCLTVGLIEPSIVLPKIKDKTRSKVFYLYSYLAVSGFISIFIFW